jgi:hypothetical protein
MTAGVYAGLMMFYGVADQSHEILWKTGPEGLSASQLVGALREMFATKTSAITVASALDADIRFRRDGDGDRYRLAIPDDTWDRLSFTVN